MGIKAIRLTATLLMAWLATLVLYSEATWAQEVSPVLMRHVAKGLEKVLRDPGSARIVSAAVRDATDYKGNSKRVVCGTVTARNENGGMSPASAFVYFIDDGSAYLFEDSIMLQPATSGFSASIYARFCMGG